MSVLELVGMKTVGNKKLLTEPTSRIGVFASRSEDPAVGIIREQWAMKKGRERRCIVGTFHSKAECEILYFVLKSGGSAVWFLGCALPPKLPDFCKRAIRFRKLLIVSCFNSEHHSYARSRYCAHLVDMCSNYLVIWSLNEKGMIAPIYQRACDRGKWVERF
ncbi:MAG: hypothetical protein HUK19_04240 [Fibrobacter sp.]|nr:hypothetical protein [Fibrobacter sp.]